MDISSDIPRSRTPHILPSSPSKLKERWWECLRDSRTSPRSYTNKCRPEKSRRHISNWNSMRPDRRTRIKRHGSRTWIGPKAPPRRYVMDSRRLANFCKISSWMRKSISQNNFLTFTLCELLSKFSNRWSKKQKLKIGTDHDIWSKLSQRQNWRSNVKSDPKVSKTSSRISGRVCVIFEEYIRMRDIGISRIYGIGHIKETLWSKYSRHSERNSGKIEICSLKICIPSKIVILFSCPRFYSLFFFLWIPQSSHSRWSLETRSSNVLSQRIVSLISLEAKLRSSNISSESPTISEISDSQSSK